jgi:hypothetical protein
VKAVLLGVALTSALFFGPTAPEPTAPGPTAPDGTALEGRADQDHIDVVAARGTAPGDSNAAFSGSAPPLREEIRAPICRRNLSDSPDLFPCSGDPITPLPECEAAEVETLAPVWQRTRADAASPWSEWTVTAPASCAAAPTVTPEMVLAEFRRMTLTPSALTVQPDRGWVLVNKPTVVYTDATDQTLTTTILGAPVAITAHPDSYRWDFGDGAVISTTHPGRPWPQADISHPYVHTGTYSITLTTTWSATFTLADDPTPRDVPGTATTASTSTPFTAEELRSHLVATTCDEDPHAPGCD